MVDKLRQLREPAAIIVELVVLANIVVGGVRVAQVARDAGLLEGMRAVGGGFMGVASLLCLVLAVAACVAVEPPTPHAKAITTAGLVLAVVGAVVSLVFLVAGLFASQPGALGAALEAVGGLTDLALKGLAAYLLWYFLRALALRRPAARPLPVEPPAQTAATDDEPRQMPTWKTDQAAGMRWNTAAEAARGGHPVAADPDAALAELAPSPAAQRTGVQPVAQEALDGPPAKADPGLWRAPSQGPSE